MSRRTRGLGLMVAGSALAAVGIVGIVSDDDGADETATPTTTVDETTASDAAPSTTVAPSTTGTSTSTTTTSSPTANDGPAIADFIDRYVAAIDADEVDALVALLHPVVLELRDEADCRAAIAEEIIPITDYRRNGAPSEPETRTFGGIDVDGVFDLPVAFTLQGQAFEIDAALAPVDGELRWFSNCG